LVEVVAQVRDGILKEHEGKWSILAQQALTDVFNSPVSKQDMDRMSRMVTIPEDIDDPVCGNCGGEASHRCSKCKNEWYCSRECQVAHWNVHESMCNAFVEAEKLELERLTLKGDHVNNERKIEIKN